MFKSANRMTIGDNVLNQFIDLLSSGVYKPEEKLPTEMEMCEALQVSRPVLREVLSALRYMGYLESVQGGGTYICKMPLNATMSDIKLRLALEKTQLMELWELRYILEVQVAGLAAERATDEEIAEIWAAFEKYENNVKEGGNNAATIHSTQNFHNMIAKAAHNDMLMDMLESIANLLSLSREKSIQVKGSSIRAAGYHRKIAQAIADRDARRVKAAMREHLLDVKRDLIAYLVQRGRQR